MDFQQKSSNLEGDNKQGDNNLQGDNRIILALRREITNSYVINIGIKLQNETTYIINKNPFIRSCLKVLMQTNQIHPKCQCQKSKIFTQLALKLDFTSPMKDNL